MRTMWRYLNDGVTTEGLFYGMTAFGATLAVGLALWILDLGFIIVAAINRLLSLWDQAYHFDGWTLYGFIPMTIALATMAVKRCRGALNTADRQGIALIEVCSYALGLLGTLHNLKLLSEGSGLALHSAMSAFNPLETGIGLWLACQLIGWQFGSPAEHNHPAPPVQDGLSCRHPMVNEPQGVITDACPELPLQPGSPMAPDPSTLPTACVQPGDDHEPPEAPEASASGQSQPVQLQTAQEA